MLDGIKSSFKKVIDKISAGGRLSEDNLKEAVRMIRTALLEADVNFKVAKDFAQRVKEKAVGQELIQSIRPGEQFVKIVNDELIALMGGNIDEMKFHSSKPT
ncbi:MAG: signal recognition particle receptor subunit alpha, partial [Planctomycetes bacterium]|nr:signal recognition particle receptor subunit alpha [Planctomycetota bacterium]